MSSRFRIRAGLAAAAATVLISGAAWRGLAATQPSAFSPVPSALRSPRRHRSYGYGHHRLARFVRDIVKNVAPAVVTIRVEGKAAAQPTQLRAATTSSPLLRRRRR